MSAVYRIEIFNCATGEFDRGSVTLGRPTYPVTFYRNLITGRFALTFVTDSIKPRRQERFLSPVRFRSVTGLGRGQYYGECMLDESQLRHAGFKVLSRIAEKGG